MRSLADKGRLYIDDDGILLLGRNLTPPVTVFPGKSGGCAARLLGSEPTQIYVPLLMRPWIMKTYHAIASCYLGVARTLSMLQ